MAILEVKNLRKRFGKTEVLKGVSFDLEAGEVLSVIGSSGSGKTTLLRCLNSLEFADSGTISVGGEVMFDGGNEKSTVGEAELRRRRLHFGLVFQSFNLFPQYTALENVMLAPGLTRRATPDENRRRAEALLADVGLAGKLNNYPCELSGGQQQRVMIASALAQNPQMLVADEPTTALDVTTQKEVLDLIDRVAGERKMAVLLITHNLGLVSRYSSYVNVMYAGKIVESGEVKSVLASPRHPYTKGLIAAVPRIDAPQDAPLVDIPGTVPPPWAWPQGCAFHPRCRNALPECSSENFTICRYLTGNQQF